MLLFGVCYFIVYDTAEPELKPYYGRDSVIHDGC